MIILPPPAVRLPAEIIGRICGFHGSSGSGKTENMPFLF